MFKALLTSLLLLGTPMAASAQMQCSVDMDGNGILTNFDVTLFITLWTAGSSLADLNGDGDTKLLVADADLPDARAQSS